MIIEPVSTSGNNLISLSRPNNFEQNQINVEANDKSVKEEKPGETALADEVLANLQNTMKILQNIDLSFSVHKASGQIVVTVINENTGEVIREIPSQELLDIAAKLEETIGLMLDKKV